MRASMRACLATPLARHSHKLNFLNPARLVKISSSGHFFACEPLNGILARHKRGIRLRPASAFSLIGVS